ncbi:YbdD/YjiX family protein [Arthrobacter deserti]|uniref:YbdD/YjiX family protein n=1 Tax=Arthrobacter deserti TaxID=1742687 RepID=A0ABX1JS13_9MICC|nr:YbdD/YjiX family protein [Arthrobacter deserti]
MAALGRAALSLRRGWHGFVWFFKGVMGENAYQAYLDHHRATHPGGTPMSEREFWRDRMDRQDASPQGRCC